MTLAREISDYDFERHFEFAKSWEKTNGKSLLRISDWNADPKDVNIPETIIQHSIQESLRNITKYAETKLLINACQNIQENLESVYKITLNNNTYIHLFGNVTQAIFGVLCGLKQLIKDPRTLIINPSYYSVKDSATLIEIPVVELNRKMSDVFKIHVQEIDKLKKQHKINIIILTDPVYSCGSCLGENYFHEVIEYCQSNNIWLVIDNAFSGLSWTDENKIWLDKMMLAQANHGKTIIIDSPSKRLFTNNMKIGIVAANIELIKKLREFSDSHIGNISGLQVAFAKAIFTEENKNTVEMICKANATRAKGNFYEIEKNISSSKFISLVRPDSGFHCVLKSTNQTIRQTNAMNICEKLITEFSTLAIPTNDFFYDQDDNFGIRINLMSDSKKSQRVIEQLSIKGFNL